MLIYAPKKIAAKPQQEQKCIQDSRGANYYGESSATTAIPSPIKKEDSARPRSALGKRASIFAWLLEVPKRGPAKGYN